MAAEAGAGDAGVSAAGGSPTESATANPAPWGRHAPSWLASAAIALARHTPLGRGAPRKLLYRVFAACHDGPVDTLLWGMPVRLYPQRNVSERKALLRPDRMDPREHALLHEAMAEPGAVFVDVGGNAGLYSLDAALHGGRGARVVMIEPDAGLIGRFAFNLLQAKAAGRIAPSVAVETHAVAISDQTGEGILGGDGEEGSRHLVDGSPTSGLRVRLMPLADLAMAIGLTRIDVMKIDVEGHEDKVLPPFFASARPDLWPRFIVIEHVQRARWSPDCIADALARGFTIAFTTRNNTILQRPQR
ncbi:MAG: FkbM family methyltransferase [Hyphomicrobium sp.]